MEKVYRSFKNKDVQFVGIFVRDREYEVQKFVQTYGLSFPVGLDDGGRSLTLTNSLAHRSQS